MSHSRTAGQDRNGPRYRVPAGLLAGLLVAGALAGCGSPAPELGRDAARQLQSQVLAVSEAAAANDPAGSLKHLDELLARLDAAAASGEVSSRRHQSIKSSIDAVRADLAAQQARPRRPERRRKKHRLNRLPRLRRQLLRQTAPAAVAPAPAPAPVANDIANSNGKSKDKGKGKG